MALNESKGNMYPWTSHTYNLIKGKCPHDCSYCYMKRHPQKDLRFDSLELATKLGKGKFIFVGSSCDAWAKEIPDVWIKSMLLQCSESPDNRYLFQTKNPMRYKEFIGEFPPEFMLGTTIESNRHYDISKAPPVYQRMVAMSNIDFDKMVSLEPVVDFDVDDLVDWISIMRPKFVSIGADSGNNHLPEPPSSKIRELIDGLKPITDVKLKDNLYRILER